MRRRLLLIVSIIAAISGIAFFLYLKNDALTVDKKTNIFSVVGNSILSDGDNVFNQNQYDSEKNTLGDGRTQLVSYCAANSQVIASKDDIYCSNTPKLNRFRLFEINLTDNVILFYENGLLVKSFPIAYQAPYGKWYQTPTGYFQLGVKRSKFMSSITDVYMEDAVQLYEDFFIHGIPYFPDGTKVTSQFSGGCIRLEDDIAKKFFGEVTTGDSVVSYLTLNNAVLKNDFSNPVKVEDYWIRQRFNSPLKVNWDWSSDKRDNYIQHAGVDLSPNSQVSDTNVRTIYDGKVEKIIHNGNGDAGLGNVVIIAHEIENSKIYSLYGHLSQINSSLYEGKIVESGSIIGVVGNTGYGCNYWKVGKDGCNVADLEDDVHLHLEIKTTPTLDSPVDAECNIEKNLTKKCVGYTPEDPTNYGYFDPLRLIYESF